MTDEVTQFGGITEAQLDAELLAFELAKLALNKVKLPSPSSSDYVSPSTVLASTSNANETGDTSQTGNYQANRIFYAKFTTVEAITLKFLGANIITAAGNIRLGLFSDTANAPVNKLVESADTVAVAGWQYISVADTVLAAATSYWIAIIHSSASLRLYSKNVTSGITHMENQAYGAFPAVATPTDDTIEMNLRAFEAYSAVRAIDEDTAIQWRPTPANEAGAWLRLDTGALKIIGGCRIYWGADAAYRPTAYTIQVSEDGTTWTTVVTETAAAPESAWKEYSWNSRYARYIRLLVGTHGASGTEIYEADYYSRIADRVASEHGHGSGITPHLKGSGQSFGFTFKDKIENIKKKDRDLGEIIGLLLNRD